MGYSSDNPPCQGLWVFFASCECSDGWQGTPQNLSSGTAEILLENCGYLWCGLTESGPDWRASSEPEITYRRQVVLAGVASCSAWQVLLCLQCFHMCQNCDTTQCSWWSPRTGQVSETRMERHWGTVDDPSQILCPIQQSLLMSNDFNYLNSL